MKLKEKKTDLENSIEKVPEDTDDSLLDMPDIHDEINLENRDGTNSKKLKIAGLFMLVLLVALIGSGITFKRYQEQKQAQKELEAMEALNENKQIKSTAELDITADQVEIENSNFKPLPPPVGAVEPVKPVEPVVSERPITPPSAPASNYRQYDNNPDMGSTRPPVIAQPSSPPPTYNQAMEAEPYVEPEPTFEFTPPPPTPEELKAQRVLQSNVLAYGKSGKNTNNSSDSNKSNTDSDIANNLTPVVLADGTASKSTNKTLLLNKGTIIPCILKTKIVSDYDGFVTCQTSKDIYSANGKTLLIERGSSVFGEQKVDIEDGKGSVFVLWNKIETPNNVSVELNSPATGQLGETGIYADVDRHFWKRFGNAILLSTIKDVIKAGTNSINKKSGDNNTTITETSDTTNDMIEEALKDDINIKPTATILQGTRVNIMVARDVDFSTVYTYQTR